MAGSNPFQGELMLGWLYLLASFLLLNELTERKEFPQARYFQTRKNRASRNGRLGSEVHSQKLHSRQTG